MTGWTDTRRRWITILAGIAAASSLGGWLAGGSSALAIITIATFTLAIASWWHRPGPTK